LLGPVEYIEHQGERPMRIKWKLRIPLPGGLFQQIKLAAG